MGVNEMESELMPEEYKDTLEKIRVDKIQRMERASIEFIKGHWFTAYCNYKEKVFDRWIRIEKKKLEVAKLKHERKMLKVVKR